ncbi:unnamed protein product [Penicillium nalgiovense]|nr:unnamed protein product [Penicillium nalgiovense]
MATPVIVSLRCNRQGMQNEIEHATDVRPGKYVHLQVCIRNDSVISALSELYHERKLLASTTWLNEEMTRQQHKFRIFSDIIDSVVALSFCAVHLAGWKDMLPSFLIGFDSYGNLWHLFKNTVLNISIWRAIQWATSIPHF